MSTARDIVDGIGRLVGSLEALLETSTFEAIIELVRQLGISQPVKTALGILSTGLNKLVDWLGTLEQVATVPAFLESMGPSILQLGQVFDIPGEQLQEAGLGVLAPLSDSAHAVVQLLERVRAAAEQVLQAMLPADALRRLRENVQRLGATLAKYGTHLDAGGAR
jgi:hypothetical protein